MTKELYIEDLTEMDKFAKKAGDRQYLEAGEKEKCEDCVGCPTCCKEDKKVGNQSKEYYE